MWVLFIPGTFFLKFMYENENEILVNNRQFSGGSLFGRLNSVTIIILVVKTACYASYQITCKQQNRGVQVVLVKENLYHSRIPDQIA